MNPKKKQIIDAAHRLFTEKGFASTSIQDILDDAQIAKGTFYNYFGSKNECLMAILEFIKEEGDQKRRDLEHGKRIDDEEVFIAQFAVRMNMNREHNLMAVFESVSISNDDLKAFIERQHSEELKWISKRLIQLFNQETERYALDHAVMLLGMVHHLMHTWKLGTSKEIPSEKTIQFALNRLKPVVNEQLQSKEVFFSENWLSLSTNQITSDITDMKNHASVHLEELIKKIGEKGSKKTDYVRFLLNELEADNPRLFLLESVLMSISHTFEQSDFEHEVSQISKIVWDIIEQLDKEQ